MTGFLIRVFKAIIIIGVVALGAFYLPEVCAFWSMVVAWIVGLGTWGTIIIVGALLYLIISQKPRQGCREVFSLVGGIASLENMHFLEKFSK